MSEDQIVEAAEKEMDALRAETEQVRAAQRKAEALLQEEQKTIRAVEDVAVEHGYDPNAENLVDWIKEQLLQRDTARIAADYWRRKHSEASSG